MRSANYIVFVMCMLYLFPYTKLKFETFLNMTGIVINLMNSRWGEETVGINLQVSVARCFTVDAN